VMAGTRWCRPSLFCFDEGMIRKSGYRLSEKIMPG
jgi:hypothetical protein